tara:strand:+ start:3851 stop:4927 length:1077 start_codon:yes stop_codon:yes gene_type:complete
MEYTNQIQKFYIAYYGRPADPEGLAYWVTQLEQNGGNLTAILEAFGTSAEYENRFGTLSPQEQINNLYQQIFGRDADDVGLAFYTGMLERGDSSITDLALDITNGALGEDVTAINKRVEVAQQFTQDVEERGLRYSGEENDAAGLLANVTADTNVAAYVESTVEPLLANLPTSDVDPTPQPEPQPEPEPSSPAVELAKGNVVFSFAQESVLDNGVSAITISESSAQEFVNAENELFVSSAGNFGDIITLQTGDDTLELVSIEFVGDSQLRDAATAVGYDNWIDMALFNGELVTADSLNISEDMFFGGDIDIENYFGYNWPSDLEPISREDGQPFTLEIEVLDSLGVANLDAVFAEALA